MKKEPAIVLADGSFPVHEIPMQHLYNSEHIICCDGSAESLVKAGLEPEAIVGDLDSLSEELQNRFAGRIFRDDDQETNDLTKAVRWCATNGFEDVIILGATGKREDHTIGNISLLAEYASFINVKMLTDTGEIIPYTRSSVISSFRGQQVSVFSIDPAIKVRSVGLKYELNDLMLHNWWRATLNESTGDSFELQFEGGTLLVFLKYRDIPVIP